MKYIFILQKDLGAASALNDFFRDSSIQIRYPNMPLDDVCIKLKPLNQRERLVAYKPITLILEEPLRVGFC